MDFIKPFTDPANVARYAADTPQRVPGYDDLHRMAMLLLTEHAPKKANILVLGAGGGLELKAFAQWQPEWHFLGVDPSAEMLQLAEEIVGPAIGQVTLQKGYITDAQRGPFDGATCLLTLHFMTKAERFETLCALRSRLAPGARLVVAQHCKPDNGQTARELTRLVAFSGGTKFDFAQAAASASVMAEKLPLLTQKEEEQLLTDAGFKDVSMFYAGFSLRGWVAVATDSKAKSSPLD
ncbi:methyltransferase domain-containing protein [Desulfovibrio aerotolerans]|uniref:Methyltransferase domain-containing protein n=1 Tax=Solidesulfovibrio aerotolerans TaxID=295255 RepID=A0A7C9N1J0_9BACT|nr:class I SAM-dependent methyltransferase [Solidesulfovibrio aerotolerans]MYL83111.1 methyltransferase domain-containing protein [Solidesulfovibrio aerotolerans]